MSYKTRFYFTCYNFNLITTTIYFDDYSSKEKNIKFIIYMLQEIINQNCKLTMMI